MSRNKLVFFIGFIVLLMPFLGFPPGVKDVFYVIAGLCLVLIAISGHMQRRMAEVNQYERGQS
jgi:hypothetical protein